MLEAIRALGFSAAKSRTTVLWYVSLRYATYSLSKAQGQMQFKISKLLHTAAWTHFPVSNSPRSVAFSSTSLISVNVTFASSPSTDTVLFGNLVSIPIFGLVLSVLPCCVFLGCGRDRSCGRRCKGRLWKCSKIIKKYDIHNQSKVKGFILNFRMYTTKPLFHQSPCCTVTIHGDYMVTVT